MPSILSLQPIAAARFNRIPLLRGDGPKLTEYELRRLAKLFVKHGAHQDYGVGIPHRHFELADGELLVHRSEGTAFDVCTVERNYKLCEVKAHSFIYFNDQFQPYEFDLNLMRLLPSAEFLHALEDLMHLLGLSNRLALVSNPPLQLRDSVEVTHLADTSMHTRPRLEEDEHHSDYQTCFAFSGETSDMATYTAYKTCRQDKTTGEHVEVKS